MNLPTEIVKQLRRDLNIPSNIFIRIKYLSDCQCHWNGYHYQGLCEPLDLQTFSITLNSSRLPMGSEKMCHVLAHELRHVKQYIDGTLESTDKTFWWNNKRHYYCYWPHAKRPHEIDAEEFATQWTKANFLTS